jgi:hypothetical protein
MLIVSYQLRRLIDYFMFYVPLKNISLIWRLLHYRWRTANFRPLLGAQGLWTWRDFYRATPAMTRGLGFQISSEGPPNSIAFYDSQGDAQDLHVFLLRSSRVQLRPRRPSVHLRSVPLSALSLSNIFRIWWGYSDGFVLDSYSLGLGFVMLDLLWWVYAAW